MILWKNKDEKKFKQYINMAINFLSFHIVIDPRYLNDYCPYCFKTKNGKSIFDDSENEYKNASLKDLIFLMIQKMLFLGKYLDKA